MAKRTISNSRFAHSSNQAPTKKVMRPARSRFSFVARVSPRGLRNTNLVTLSDDRLIINSAFGRHLDSDNVTAFSILVDDHAEQLGLMVYRHGEEDQMPAADMANVSVIKLRPEGKNKNPGRRVNIRHLVESKQWLRRQMICEDEVQKRRFPIFDEAEQLWVLHENVPAV